MADDTTHAAELKRIKCQPYCLSHNDINFIAPTATEIREVRVFFELTQVDVAKLVGVSWYIKPKKSGSSTVAKWETPEDQNEHRAIPYSAWRLLLITLKVAKA